MNKVLSQALHTTQYNTWTNGIKKGLLSLNQSMQNFVTAQSKALIPYIEAESGLSIAKGYPCPCKVYLLSPKVLELYYQGTPKNPSDFYDIDRQAQFIAETLVERMERYPHLVGSDVEKALQKLSQRIDQELAQLESDEYLCLDEYETLANRFDLEPITDFNTPNLDELSLEAPDELLRIIKDLDQSSKAIQLADDDLNHPKYHLRHQLELILDLINADEEVNRCDREKTITDPLAVYKSQRSYTHSTHPKSMIRDAQPMIELYSLKIALCTENIKSTLIGLTTKVLVHELSHWNTHLGLDSDLQTWLSFHDADKLSIEGSAQDLTLRSLERMASSYFTHKPARRRLAVLALIAFYQLNVNQTKPYRIHRDWLKYSKETRRKALQILRTQSGQYHKSIELYEYMLQGIGDLKSTGLMSSNVIPF